MPRANLLANTRTSSPEDALTVAPRRSYARRRRAGSPLLPRTRRSSAQVQDVTGGEPALAACGGDEELPVGVDAGGGAGQLLTGRQEHAYRAADGGAGGQVGLAQAAGDGVAVGGAPPVVPVGDRAEQGAQQRVAV